MTKKTTTATKRKAAARNVKSSKAALKPLSFEADALKSAVLIISLLINLFVLSLWVALQVTSQYDQALFDFFIHR